MKRLQIILMVSVALMCSCSSSIQKATNEVVLIVHNSQPDNIMRFSNRINSQLPVEDTMLFASYLDDSLQKIKLHTRTPLDTFKIKTERDFMEIICRYRVSDHRTFFIKRGDTIDVRFNAQKEPIFESRTNSNLNLGYNILLSANDSSLKYNFTPYTLRDDFIFRRIAYAKAENPKVFESFKDNYIDPDTLQIALNRFNQRYNTISNDKRLHPQQREYAKYYLKILDAGNRYAPELLSDDYIEYSSYIKFLNGNFIARYHASKDIPLAYSSNGVYTQEGGENAYSMLFDTLRIDSSIPPKTKLALLEICLETLDHIDHPTLERHIEQYLAEGGSKDIANKFLSVIQYDEFSSLKLVDTRGQELTLQDVLDRNLGNVVYLDFWGTNCPPCIAAMPKAQELREAMKNEDITFVFIALWDNKDTWTNRWHEIIGKEINYESYFSTNSDSPEAKMLGDLRVGSIPRYMIFNQEGKLVNADAQSPMNPTTKQVLEKYL